MKSEEELKKFQLRSERLFTLMCAIVITIGLVKMGSTIRW